MAAILALGGCSSPSWSSINPENWWHNLEGGAIAQQRPPPPGVNQPPPNLATVPPKPAEPDRASLQDIADALVADRANAQHMAAAAPLVDPSSPTASPSLFGVGSVPPPGPAPPPGAAPAASATLPAANAPPTAAAQPAPAVAAPATPPSKAPVGEVKSAALPEPTAPPAPLTVGPDLPALPTAPPAPAKVTGVPAPAAPAPTAMAAKPPVIPAPTAAAVPAAPPTPAPIAAATPPPAVRPPAVPAAPAPAVVASLTPPGEPRSAGNTVAVVFANGAFSMPPSSAAPLRALANRRGNGLIAVTGYGDAADANPDAQAAALKLGLSRAQSIAAALVADGVPASAVQIDAQAMGRGGTARLVQ